MLKVKTNDSKYFEAIIFLIRTEPRPTNVSSILARPELDSVLSSLWHVTVFFSSYIVSYEKSYELAQIQSF